MTESRQRVAVVTGGFQGLGALICEELLRQGYFVVIWDWEVSVPLPRMLGVEAWVVDVSNHVQVEQAAQEMQGKNLTPIDVLVNCAGVAWLDWIPSFSLAKWQQVQDVNVTGPLLTVKHLAPLMNGGTIVNIGSNAGVLPMRTGAAYCASKAALNALTEVMARELMQTHQITVFGLNPNKLAGTQMTESIDWQTSRLRQMDYEAATAHQRAGMLTGQETDPKQVAEFLGFLLSSKERHAALAGCILPYGK